MDDDVDEECASDAEDIVVGHIKNKHIRRLQFEYYKYCHDNDGFDVLGVVPPGVRYCGMIFLVDFKNDKAEHAIINKCLDFAIALYNRSEGPKSKLVDVAIERVTSNLTTFSSYYITFRARDDESGKIDTYETKVRYEFPDDHLEMHLFRKKGTKKGMLFCADFDDTEDYNRITKCSNFAIFEENKEREAKGMSTLKLERIVKAYYRETSRFRTYYIILEAKDSRSNSVDPYITKMYIGYDEDGDVLNMMLFRPKSGEKVMWSDDDDEVEVDDD